MNGFRVLMASTAMAAVAVTTCRVASADDDNSSAANSDKLEQVTVTATKRTERLQDVPVSVTALTSSVLERNNVRELGDLVNLAPGLVVTYGSQPGNFVISMRGIGTFSSGVAVESDVAVVIDDVPVAYQAAAFKDLVDVERIEVLKGPQSTLFGKSAIAGVVNITTQAPTAEFTGKAMSYVTNDGEKRGGFSLSGPFSDTLRYRLTVSYSDYDGNVTNIYDDKKINGSSGLTATGKLQWTPNDNLTVSLEPRTNWNHSTCCVGPITSLTPGLYYQGETQFPESVVLKGIPVGPTNHYVDMDYRDGGGDSRTSGVTGRVNYHFDDSSFLKNYDFASISSTDHWLMHDYQDQDGTAVPFLLDYPLSAPSGIDSGAYQYGFFHANSVTQEFRLTSPSQSRIRYVTGLWYAHNALNRWLWKGPVLNATEYLGVTHNTNYSLYGQATLDLTNKLSLIGGARRNLQKLDYTFITYYLQPNLHFGQANQEWSNTGRAGLEYHWTPDIMSFATWSTGYKGQAYDLVSTFNAKEAAQMPVPHETARNFEVGLKSSLLDQRVYFDVTLFDADYYGFQTSITGVLPDGTFLTYLQSIGHLRTRGVEMDGAAKVTRNFTLNASLAATDATIVNFPGAPCYGPTVPYCLNGKPLDNVPKVKFNLGGEYDQPLPGMPFGAFATFAYRHQSAVNFALNEDPHEVQPQYGIANFSLGINDNSDRYKASVFVNNAFDKHYAVSIADTTSGFKDAGGSSTGTAGTAWTMPRDEFRYFGARVDVTF